MSFVVEVCEYNGRMGKETEGGNGIDQTQKVDEGNQVHSQTFRKNCSVCRKSDEEQVRCMNIGSLTPEEAADPKLPCAGAVGSSNNKKIISPASDFNNRGSDGWPPVVKTNLTRLHNSL